MVDLLETSFPLQISVTKKVILVLLSVFFFLNLDGPDTIDVIFIVRIFFDLVLGRNKAKSGSNFWPRGLLVTLQIYKKQKLDVINFNRAPINR